MIIKGPNVPKGKIKTPVSLVDIFPTVVDSLKLKKNIKDTDLLWKIIITNIKRKRRI